MPAVEPRPKTWTREEYYRLAAAGAFEGQRVQLVEGGIVEMSPQSSRHATGIQLVTDILRAVLGPGVLVRVQLPLALGKLSDPDPDVAVVRGSPRDWAERHPDSALLVVEVADTTLAYDRREKASLYAKARILEYWVLDLVDGKLEVHREPRRDPGAVFGAAYGSVVALDAAAQVSPLAAPTAKIPVKDLLP
ncbi:MAG: Uma2 family endonuclease [Planctomycetales bacterium]|nr:Uma2 family endonuclease [Planctomycetales bacterium]